MGTHRSEGATAVLGMDGFVVGAQVETDGELWLMVETTADVVGCDGCGTRPVSHGRREVKVCDLPIADRRVVLLWRKRLWRFTEPDCEVKTWSEDTDAVAPRAVLTERARAEICRRVARDGHSVAQLAREFGASWHAAMEAARDHGRPRADHLSRLRTPQAIGVDETSFLAANATHPTLMVTGNLLVKKVKRVSHGFRNFESYRLRLLLHCGVQWQLALPHQMRVHPPRLAA